MLHLETNNNIIGNTKKCNLKILLKERVKVNKKFILIVCIDYSWVEDS